MFVAEVEEEVTAAKASNGHINAAAEEAPKVENGLAKARKSSQTAEEKGHDAAEVSTHAAKLFGLGVGPPASLAWGEDSLETEFGMQLVDG